MDCVQYSGCVELYGKTISEIFLGKYGSVFSWTPFDVNLIILR